MERLNIYTMDFSIEELKGMKSLKGYELCRKEICLEDRSNLEGEVPAIFVFRNPSNGTALWRYIHMVRARKMNAAFLILFSKQDFVLLYGACQNGITAVQMEPASRNELERQIKRCLEKISEVSRTLSERARLEEYEFDKHQKIMERLLEYVLEKPQEVELLLPEINKRYGTKLGEGVYQVFVISVNRYELCNKTSHFLKEIALLATHTLHLAKDVILGYKEPYGLIGILYFENKIPLEDRKADYQKLWDKVMGLREYYGDFRATLGVGNPVEGIVAVSDSLRKAAFVQEYRMTLNKYVLLAEEVQEPKQLDEYVPERRIKELIRFVSMGESEQVKAWFASFYREVEPGFWEYPPAFAKFCWAVYIACRPLVHFQERKFFHLQHIFDGSERNREIEVILLEICHMMKQEYHGESDVATQAIAYMEVHYAEPINLEYIADKCGFSTSYFSRMFKEQTGEKYIDVLTDIRVREAKRLLETTQMSVLEIVEAVGYCDEKHFRRVFYKNTGMNPLAYRKKNKKPEEEK